MEMMLLYAGCALFAVCVILIIGPGKKSTPLFATGVVAGLLGTAGLMFYSVLDGFTPVKVVLLVLWLLIIVATVSYVIRAKRTQRSK